MYILCHRLWPWEAPLEASTSSYISHRSHPITPPPRLKSDIRLCSTDLPLSTTNATYIPCMFAYMFQWIQIELYKLEVPCRWKWRCLRAGHDQCHRRLWERPCPRGQAYDLYTAGTRRGAMKDNSSRPDIADPSWSMSYGGKSQLTPGCPSNHLINMWMYAMDNCSVI